MNQKGKASGHRVILTVIVRTRPCGQGWQGSTYRTRIGIRSGDFECNRDLSPAILALGNSPVKRTKNKGCPRAAFLQSNAITASGSHISPAAKGRNPKEAAMPGAACGASRRSPL